MTFLTLPNCPGGGGTSVGPLQSFGGVGRGDHGWGHSRTGVSTCGTVSDAVPVDVTVVPVLPVEGPQSVPLQVAVVRVDGTIAGDTSGRNYPRDERDWRPPTGVSMMDGGAGSLSGGGGRRWPPRMFLEVSFRWCLLRDLP